MNGLIIAGAAMADGMVAGYENNLQDPSLERVKQLALILHTSLDYLVGLDDAYTLRLPPMTDEQRSVLNEFLRVFVTSQK